MIAVRIADLETAQVDAVFRPVRWDLEPLTPGARRVGLGAGELIIERVAQMGDFPVGGAVVTPGGDLPSDFIIHLVIESFEEPVTQTGVRKALTNGLRQACAWGVESVALPPMGIGAGSLEAETAARIVVSVLRAFLESCESLREATIMVANEYEKAAFESVLAFDGPRPAKDAEESEV